MLHRHSHLHVRPEHRFFRHFAVYARNSRRRTHRCIRPTGRVEESIRKENPKDDDAHRPERWLLDSSASHILAGAYSAIFAVILTIVGMIVTLPDTPAIPEWSHHVCTALILLFSSHVATSVLVSLPALYSAYVQVNEVPPALNGNDSTR